MSVADLSELCVTRFPLSKRRESIMHSLEALLANLSSAGVKAEAWINGSFLTEKIDPDDVDLVVLVQQPDWPSDQGGKEALARVARQEFKNPLKCDSYLSIEYPAGHPLNAFGLKQRDYWLKQFGESRGGTNKGLAVLDIPIK